MLQIDNEYMKQQSIRSNIKTTQAFLSSKSQTTAKIKQITLHELVQIIQIQRMYIKTQQIKNNDLKKNSKSNSLRKSKE